MEKAWKTNTKRKCPTKLEQEILIKGIQKYFSYPERSVERNMISHNISQRLHNWNQHEVRIYFNNNKHYYQPSQESDANNNTISQISIKNPFILPIISSEKSKTSYSNDQDSFSKINNAENNSSIQATKIDEKQKNSKVLSMLNSRKLNKEKNEKINSSLNNLRAIKFSSEKNSDINKTISTVQTFQSYFTHKIFDEMESNLDKKPQGHRYTEDYIECSYLLKYGSNPYDYLRTILPFPCEQTLRNWKKNDNFLIKNNILENGDMHKIIDYVFKYDMTFDSIKSIKCVISIDAIEFALFHKSDEKIKNIFIFFLIPLIIGIKPFPIKVIRHENGKVSPKILELILSQISELFIENSKVTPEFISSDGDSGYNTLYSDEFELIYKQFKKYEMDGFSEFINSIKNDYSLKKLCLILADLIHFLKNRRTQIIMSVIIMKGYKIPVACFDDYLKNNAAIADRSSLSKLQDTFPLKIFNFQIFLSALKDGNFDLSYYLFPIVCWNECYNNQIIGKKTRLYLLECAMFGFKSFYEKQIKSKDPTEIMPQQAIKRAFATCALVFNEFLNSNGEFNFAMFGTMLQEHFHGIIRGMTHGVDTLVRTIDSIVKSNTIMNILNKQKKPLKKKTRYSVGGTHYNPLIHIKEYLFSSKPKDVIKRLEDMSIYGNRKEFNDFFLVEFFSWIEIVGEGSLRIQCTNKHFHYGRHIISREITNYQEIKDEEKQFRNEIEAINQLFEEEEDDDYSDIPNIWKVTIF